MKIQIDTTAKVIKLEESANLGELQNFLEKIFSNGEWKDYRLETENKIITPIVINQRNFPLYPTYPLQPNPIITCGDEMPRPQKVWYGTNSNVNMMRSIN